LKAAHVIGDAQRWGQFRMPFDTRRMPRTVTKEQYACGKFWTTGSGMHDNPRRAWTITRETHVRQSAGCVHDDPRHRKTITSDECTAICDAHAR
jgi:hypothetical protein